MIITGFLPKWMVWVSWKWPFIHVRKGRKVTPRPPLTLMEELHIQFEARLIANGGQALPIDESIDPTLEEIERVRQRWLKGEIS